MSHFSDNFHSAKKNAEFYDTFWQSFTDEIFSDEKKRVKAIIRLMKIFSTNKNNTNILDSGCGRGWMAPFLSQYGKYTGVDFSDEGIKYAKLRHGHLGDFFLLNDMNVIPNSWISKSNIIVSSEVIEHLHYHDDYIKELTSYLAHDGILILTTPNGNLWSVYSEYMHSTGNYMQPIENWITPAQLKELLVKNNYSILEHNGIRDRNFFVGNLLRDNLLYKIIEYINGRIKSFHQRSLVVGLYQIICARKIS